MNKDKGENTAGSPDLEEALVDRLRQLEWPRPTSEVKQRCLDDIVARMSDVKDESSPQGSAERRGRIRGRGERHSLTRYAAVLNERQPLRAPDRPVRLATVLW